MKTAILVRQPHNSSLTVLARLGFVGLSIWLLFIGLVLARFVRLPPDAIRIRGSSRSTILWLFLCFLLFLEISSVQPELEFSHGTMPVLFLAGPGHRDHEHQEEQF